MEGEKLTAEAYKAYMETRYLARPQIRRDAGKGTWLLAKCAITKACAVTLSQLQFESGQRGICPRSPISATTIASGAPQRSGARNVD